MKTTFALLFNFLPLMLLSQDYVGFAIGGNLNTVTFKNSEGIKNKNLKGSPGASASVLYETSLSKGNKRGALSQTNQLATALGYKSGHVKDKSSHVLTTWNFNYITAAVGIKHFMKSKTKVTPAYGGTIVADYLVSGSQNRGFEQYDLSHDIAKTNLSICLDAGLNYKLSEEAYCTISLTYLRGVTNLEKDPEQKAYLHAWKLTAAVMFSLKKNK